MTTLDVNNVSSRFFPCIPLFNKLPRKDKFKIVFWTAIASVLGCWSLGILSVVTFRSLVGRCSMANVENDNKNKPAVLAEKLYQKTTAKIAEKCNPLFPVEEPIFPVEEPNKLEEQQDDETLEIQSRETQKLLNFQFELSEFKLYNDYKEAYLKDYNKAIKTQYAPDKSSAIKAFEFLNEFVCSSSPITFSTKQKEIQKFINEQEKLVNQLRAQVAAEE